MIDLTPLDVRKKRGDFRRALRGYEPEEVDSFLELVAERMEVLVRENLALGERAVRLQEQVGSLEGREKAVHEALVTAEKLRGDVQEQARREAEIIRREAEAAARRIVEEAERAAMEQRTVLAGLERERRQFLRSFRALLERQLERLEGDEAELSLALPAAGLRGEAPPVPHRPPPPSAPSPPLPVGGAAAWGEPPPGISSVPPEAVTPTTLPGEGARAPAVDGDGAATGEETVPEHGGDPLLAVGRGESEADAAAEQREREEGAPPGRGPSSSEGEVEDLSRWLASFLEDEGGARR